MACTHVSGVKVLRLGAGPPPIIGPPCMGWAGVSCALAEPTRSAADMQMMGTLIIPTSPEEHVFDEGSDSEKHQNEYHQPEQAHAPHHAAHHIVHHGCPSYSTAILKAGRSPWTGATSSLRPSSRRQTASL